MYWAPRATAGARWLPPLDATGVAAGTAGIAAGGFAGAGLAGAAALTGGAGGGAGVGAGGLRGGGWCRGRDGRRLGGLCRNRRCCRRGWWAAGVEGDLDAAVDIIRLHNRRCHVHFDRAASPLACGREIAALRVSSEDRIREGIGVGRVVALVDAHTRTRTCASDLERVGVGHPVELGDSRSRVAGPAVEQNVSTAVLLEDLVFAGAHRSVVAEQAAAAVAGAVAAIDVPRERSPWSAGRPQCKRRCTARRPTA